MDKQRTRGHACQTKEEHCWPGEERGGEAAAPKEFRGRRIKEEDSITMTISEAKGLTMEMLIQLCKKKKCIPAPAQKSTKTKVPNESTICYNCGRNILWTEYDSHCCDNEVSNQISKLCDESLSRYALKEHRSRNYPALRDLDTELNKGQAGSSVETRKQYLSNYTAENVELEDETSRRFRNTLGDFTQVLSDKNLLGVSRTASSTAGHGSTQISRNSSTSKRPPIVNGIFKPSISNIQKHPTTEKRPGYPRNKPHDSMNCPTWFHSDCRLNDQSQWEKSRLRNVGASPSVNGANLKYSSVNPACPNSSNSASIKVNPHHGRNEKKKQDIKKYICINRRIRNFQEKRDKLMDELQVKYKELSLLEVDLKAQQILKKNLQKKKEKRIN